MFVFIFFFDVCGDNFSIFDNHGGGRVNGNVDITRLGQLFDRLARDVARAIK
jgi:hypothetical protein